MEVVSNRPVEGRKTVTVPFCDLVAYTELAEVMAVFGVHVRRRRRSGRDSRCSGLIRRNPP